MELNHREEILKEPLLLIGTSRRMESLVGPGVRRLGRDRCKLHWDTVRNVFDARQRRALRQITRAILAEACVLMAEENVTPDSHFRSIKELYSEMK